MLDSENLRLPLKGLLSPRDPRRHRVWSAFYSSHKQVLAQYSDVIAPSYLKAFAGLDMPADQAPSLEWLSQKAHSVGWSVEPVHGYLRGQDLFGCLASHQFPLSVAIRAEKFVHHSPMPDFIHDVFGHFPFLFDDGYRAFATRLAESFLRAPVCPLEDRIFDLQQELGAMANAGASEPVLASLRAEIAALNAAVARRPSLRSKLLKLYLWTVEFGFHDRGTAPPVVVGAGILSSRAELEWAIRQPKPSLSTANVMTPYDFIGVQSQYFNVAGWSGAEALLEEVEREPQP